MKSRNAAAIVTAVIGVSIAGCSEPPKPTTLVANSPLSAKASAGAVVFPAPSVKVLDEDGNPVSGVEVSFSVSSGGGQLAAPTATTGAAGIATSAAWTLPVNPSSQTLQASVSGLSGSPVTFTVTGVAGPPAAIAPANPGNNLAASIGTALPIAPQVRVTDKLGNPVPGASVTFAVVFGGGSFAPTSATTNEAGLASAAWTLGSSIGQQVALARVTGTNITTQVVATAWGPPVSLTITGGNLQAAMVGDAVLTLPSVRVADVVGAGIGGLTVNFDVVLGGGVTTGATAITNASGVATVGSWKVGNAPNVNTLTATVPTMAGPNNTVTFTASGCSGGGNGYRMTLCFNTDMTASQKNAFIAAAARWGTLIANDPTDAPVVNTIPAGQCGGFAFQLPAGMVIDDLLVFASILPLDGVSGVLGAAGPCFVRSATGVFQPGDFTVVGAMIFDAADVASLEADGSLNSVILHEMGHVIGIGSLWETFGLLKNKASVGSAQPPDTYFSGLNAQMAFGQIGGNTYTGQKVPVENAGGGGTINGHWRESVLQNELMTGFLDAGPNPLSELTVRSLQDLGYTVDVTVADPFSLTLALSAQPRKPLLRLENDVLMGPLYGMDRQGRIRRIR